MEVLLMKKAGHFFILSALITLCVVLNRLNVSAFTNTLDFISADEKSLKSVDSEEIADNPEANIRKWKNILNQTETDNDLLRQAEAYKNLGLANSYIAQYDKSFEYYNKALIIYEKKNNLFGVAEINNNIGIIYKYIKNFEKSIEHYNKALGIFYDIKNDSGVAQSLTYIGNIFYHKNNYAEAVKYFEKSLEYITIVDNPKIFTFPLNNLGTIYLKRENPQKALDYFIKAYELSVRIKSKWDAANSLNNLGDVYTAMNQFEKAASCLNESLKISAELNAKDLQADSYKFLKNLYLKKGDRLNYLENYKSYSDLKLEIFDIERAKNIYEQQMKFESEKLEIKNKILKLNNFYQRLIIFGLAIIILLVLFFIFKLKKSNKEIHKQKIKLEEVINEKNEFIGIASHDLKNPLCLIKGGNDLIISYTEDPKIRQLTEIIDNGASRMQHIITNILDANMIENAGVSPNKTKINVCVILKELIEHYKIPAEKKCIKIETAIGFENEIIETDESLLKQALDNIISNAIKYSFKGGNIQVSGEKKNGKIQIRIKDSGPGLSKEDLSKMFNKFTRLTPKPTGDEESVGLGLFIVKKLCDMLGYKIYCESVLGKGAAFILEI